MPNNSTSPIAVDLFCGAGGLSEGLKQAGFATVLGVDWDPSSVESFAANHPHARAICDDIARLTPYDIFDAADTEDIDLIAGGPSCQGYSTHGKRIEEDPRNFLFREFVRIVTDVRPRFFIMENVKGLLAYRNGYFRRLIAESFERSGYAVVSGTLCAADYGVPQLRHRVFFLGTRLDVPLSLPPATHAPIGDIFDLRPYVTVDEAIDDLPLMLGDLNRKEWPYAHPPHTLFQQYARHNVTSDFVSLHQANGLSAQAQRIVRFVKQGQGLRAVPVEELPERFRRMRTISDGSLRRDCTTLYHRLNPERPAYTITCYYRNVASGPFLHPYEDRSLSHREAARIMSFPDSFQFRGNGIPRQIGNAVPPLLARAVGAHLLRLGGYSPAPEDDLADLATA